MFIIKLENTGRVAYVESYSNTHAAPRATFNKGIAKPFDSQKEAEQWAKEYLPAYNHKIEEV
jgi:hypothetical protein